MLKSVSLYWQESAIYVALYAGFAIVVCLVVSALEWQQQTTSTPFTRLLFKAAVVATATGMAFCLWLYVVSWRPRLLGSEVLTGVTLLLAWGWGLYLLNQTLYAHMGITLRHPALMAWLMPMALLLPCAAGYALLMAPGAGWRN